MEREACAEKPVEADQHGRGIATTSPKTGSMGDSLLEVHAGKEAGLCVPRKCTDGAADEIGFIERQGGIRASEGNSFAFLNLKLKAVAQ